MIEINGVEQVIAKYRAAPAKMRPWLEDAMDKSLDMVVQVTPSYPAPPPGSKYRRTGMLARSLGSSMGGGKSGPPDIQDVRFGSNFIEGEVGSRLGYAQYVIGQETQAWMHRGRWWTNKALAYKATKYVKIIWQQVVEKLAAWMKGR